MSSALEFYDWPKVDVLRQCVPNSYMLIILFCIHIEHITGNLLVMLQLLLPVHCQNKFLFAHDLLPVIYHVCERGN